jgi:integrase
MELLKPAEFVIASLLVNRGELAFAELLAAATDEIPRGTVSTTLGMLTRRGLLARMRERLPNGYRRATYRITDHGRAAWTDFVDWVACIARGEPSTRRAAAVEAPRLPTADERRELLAAAPPEFGRLLAFCWSQPDAGVTELVQADVEDFDRAAGELVIGWQQQGRRPTRRRLTLTPEAAAVAAEAAGLRRSGPLFAAPRAGRFRAHSVTVQFRHLCERRGVGRHVRLRLAGVQPPSRPARDRLFLAWYEERGAATFHSPQAIRERWNRERPDDPIPDGNRGYHSVNGAIHRARRRRNAERREADSESTAA